MSPRFEKRDSVYFEATEEAALRKTVDPADVVEDMLDESKWRKEMWKKGILKPLGQRRKVKKK